MRKFLHIVRYTVLDLVHQKSFYILLAVCIGFVLLLRGCYNSNIVMQGQVLDAANAAWIASVIAFFLVSAGVLLITAVFSMPLLRRDREDGTAQYILSSPVSRTAYLAGRVIGIWLASFAFMFVLHVTIFIIAWMNTGGVIPGFLMASCLCSAGVLFMVLMVCLFSCFMPDFAAAFLGLGMVAISYISEMVFHFVERGVWHPSTASTIRLVWPKFFSLQYFAASLFDKVNFQTSWPVHPLINMLVYMVIAAALLLLAFNKREI